ncbi:hypothetical protein EVAR_22535_1 [Eumeta japonica]|uniref:Uncharacterized protein n=1 Tax=Eumeta variegata TaxID=151549 RepID=A0A4C1U7F7_EUMVA|nr:hypothetical protein EVAR_22535_1 [Eumeta japonica]
MKEESPENETSSKRDHQNDERRRRKWTFSTSQSSTTTFIGNARAAQGDRGRYAAKKKLSLSGPVNSFGTNSREQKSPSRGSKADKSAYRNPRLSV